ncbi:MAG: carbohydrate ABC transporter permease [Clostridia bacterium]|nr:carbohydrate ABC transporter permease [Clostridia bacterium]
MAKYEKKVGIISAVELKKPKYKAIYWSMYAFLILCVFVNLFPTIWIMLSGFKEVKEIYSVPPTLFPSEMSFSKLFEVWSQLKLGRNYLNSLFIVLGDVAFAIVVNALGGYVISKIKPKGTQLVFAIVVWTMLMPSAGRTVPIYMQIVDFPLIHVNMTNTYLPMWLMAGANCFNLLMFKNFFDSISISLVEAAKIDGATDIGVFWKILLPLSVPIITYVGINAAQGAWGAFFWPNIVIEDQNMIPMATKLYKMKSEAYTLDKQFLALIFSIIPSLLVFMIFQKQIMGGINVGGVKG